LSYPPPSGSGPEKAERSRPRAAPVNPDGPNQAPVRKAFRVARGRIKTWITVGGQKIGRPGQLIFVTAGYSVEKFDDPDPVLKDQIARNFPIYREPPPGDDARPNETNWTYYKKVKQGKEKPSVK
jgi:hypothetical protein